MKALLISIGNHRKTFTQWGNEFGVNRATLITRYLKGIRGKSLFEKPFGLRHGNTKHGLSRSEEYKIWWGMKKRCFYKTDISYPNYGGRGITICERWLGSGGFNNFLKDMGFRPTENHSIERKNNNGNYTPKNCVWATRKEQGRNRRNVRIVTISEDSKTIQEWSNSSGVKYATIRKRFVSGLRGAELLAKPRYLKS